MWAQALVMSLDSQGWSWSVVELAALDNAKATILNLFPEAYCVCNEADPGALRGKYG